MTKKQQSWDFSEALSENDNLSQSFDQLFIVQKELAKGAMDVLNNNFSKFYLLIVLLQKRSVFETTIEQKAAPWRGLHFNICNK